MAPFQAEITAAQPVVPCTSEAFEQTDESLVLGIWCQPAEPGGGSIELTTSTDAFEVCRRVNGSIPIKLTQSTTPRSTWLAQFMMPDQLAPDLRHMET